MKNNELNLDEYTVFEEEEFNRILNEFYNLNNEGMIVEDKQKKLNYLRNKIKKLWEEKR